MGISNGNFFFAQTATHLDNNVQMGHYGNKSLLAHSSENFIIINPGTPEEFKLFIVFHVLPIDIIFSHLTAGFDDFLRFSIEQQNLVYNYLEVNRSTKVPFLFINSDNKGEVAYLEIGEVFSSKIIKVYDFNKDPLNIEKCFEELKEYEILKTPNISYINNSIFKHVPSKDILKSDLLASTRKSNIPSDIE